jgi:hypothetical protein
MTILDHIPLRPKRPAVDVSEFQVLKDRVAKLEDIIASGGVIESEKKRGRPAKVEPELVD